MKNMLYTALFLIQCIASMGQSCPIYGDKPVARFMRNDSLKNRSVITEGDEVDTTITLNEILTADGNDTENYNSSHLVELTGYVILVKYGGPETCNCHSKDKKDLDIHIELALTPEAKAKDAMVVEVNRFTRVQYPERTSVDYLKKFIGKKVKATGYLFFDEEHKNNATTTGKAKNIWRYTCWEVHPVLHLEPIENE
jgi:hypothetical protein